jgi:hypothetical protein
VIDKLQAPAALPPGIDPLRYPLDRRLGGPEPGLDVMEKRTNSCSFQESNPGRPARSLAAIQTELSWLLKDTLSHVFHYVLLRHHLVISHVNTEIDSFTYSRAYRRNMDGHISFYETARKIRYFRNRKEIFDN